MQGRLFSWPTITHEVSFVLSFFVLLMTQHKNINKLQTLRCNNSRIQNTWSLAFLEFFERYKTLFRARNPYLGSVLLSHANVIQFSNGMVFNLLEKFFCNFCGSLVCNIKQIWVNFFLLFCFQTFFQAKISGFQAFF